MNAYTELERALSTGELGHKQVAGAYRAWIRRSKVLPEGTKNILSIAGGGGLLGELFQVMSHTIGSIELSYRRGYAQGLADAAMAAERKEE